ncbi:MAG: SAM-dependent DNA methyltransferase, partial [Microbacteriaceae bacterium]|nr:SAM-dependent DNA methyltransferase [Microbacteriaceae bacterium]
MHETNHVAFIWNIAESLRGPFKPNEYGDVVLPFTVLRRMELVLKDTKAAVVAEHEKLKGTNLPAALLLPQVSGHSFYNTSPFDLNRLAADPEG